MGTSFQGQVDEYWTDLMNNQIKVNGVETSALNLSKAKFDNSRIVSAGIII
jgi:hypothetical protein